MKKNTITKLTSLSLASIVLAGALVGCGSSTSSSDSASSDTSSEASGATGELETITVAASATPHAEILEAAKAALAEQGYDLQVKVFDDYVQPNEVVEAGEFDANYFQHIPYLNSFNEEHGTHLVDAGDIHYEPFGIYPGTKSSLDDIADGDVIAIPNDTTNEARALLLLQDNGLLTLKDGVGLEATVNDIVENPHNLDFEELEAAQVARVTGEVAYVVLNGNYALEAGYSVAKDSIAYESSDSVAAETYVNIIAVAEGHENDAKIQALVSVLKSDEIKKFIEDTYDGAVVFYEN
jgi:D-methionine transport system substrate-binding protein